MVILAVKGDTGTAQGGAALLGTGTGRKTAVRLL